MLFVTLSTIAICTLLGVWFGITHLRLVRLNQALIICNGVTGTMRRLVIGPRATLLWPFEREVPLDLAMQTGSLRLETVSTADLAVATTLDIFYTFDPALLQKTDLDRLLPAVPAVPKIVESWAEHILRSQVAGLTTADLLTNPAIQSRLQGRLTRTLQAILAQFGLKLHATRLLCQPVPAMLETQLAAKRTELKAQAQAQALATIAGALKLDGNLFQLVALGLPPIWGRHRQTHIFRN